MKILILILVIYPIVATASLPDYFGGSVSTMGISNQCSFDSEDAANNYFCPAILAMNEKNSFSFNSLSVHQNFTPIKNIVTENALNNPTASTVYGDVDVNQSDSHHIGVHASLKVLKKSNTKLAFSLYTPVDKFIDANTGDFYGPEYVMYKSRYRRMQFYSSLSMPYNEKVFYSLGVLGGLQSSGRTNIVAADSGSTEPSSGSVQFNASPTIAPYLSAFYKINEKSSAYLSYHSEMESNFEHFADGYTPVGSSSVKYDWKLSSMLFYDPATLRVGYQFKKNSHRFIGTIEQQFWSGYETPKLDIKNQGGILISSKDYEEISAEDITIFKLGYKLVQDKSTIGLGFGLRPTPIKKDHTKSGNSLDSDETIVSASYLRSVNFLEQDFNISLGAQVHKLESVKVQKSDGKEDGTAGSKVGTGGYEIGGEVFVFSLGLSWVL